MKERLIIFLAYLKIGQDKFEKTVGLSRGFVNKVGDSIRENNLNKISNAYPELNIAWLKTGEGDMLKSNKIESISSPSDSSPLSRDYMDIIKMQAESLRVKDEQINSLISSLATKDEQMNKVITGLNEKDETNKMLVETNRTLIERLEKKIEEKGEHVGNVKGAVG